MNAILTLQELHGLGYRMRLDSEKIRVKGPCKPSFELEVQIRRNREGLKCLLEEGLPLKTRKEGSA